MINTFPAAPRDARHAASQGFNFREGSFEVEDDFTDANKMVRRGTAELSDSLGNTIEVPFIAHYEFGLPTAVGKAAA